MAQMNVFLPDDLQSWADARAIEGGFSSTSDYICDLVRRDREDAQKLAALQAAIDAGRASPEVDTSIEDIIARGMARHGLG
ncbi:MAG: type II toxin-antitoxin system ParD family antitoxin [Pseudomonadota bacterium]|jgi:antitoxin ParD1/3/4